MMKISKPVLTNDFILSPVQFTSLNTIVFKNVKNVYDGNEKIALEYEHSSKIEASSRDWIGIFPRGWSTLQQYVTFEWASQSLPCGNSEHNKENGDFIRRMINFCPKYHAGTVNGNSYYQFVYVSKQIEVLGVSCYFRFDMSSFSDPSLELECLVPVSAKLRSTSVCDFGILMPNKISSSTSLDTKTLQTTSIHSLQNLDTEGKNWAKPPLSVYDLKKPCVFPRKTAGTGDALDPYSSHSEPIFPLSFTATQCKKCFHFKRGGGELMRSQQVLQSKVGPRSDEASEFSGVRRTLGHEYLSADKLKIVMERNKVLEERAIEMKKEMDRLQAESKKLKTSFYNVNKEKVAYEKFVKDFIKSLEKDSIVRVVNGNTEILVKKVNYVGMEEHPRDKKTSKRERELKAVIGLQEITIRNLINSLQEKAKSVQELNQTVKLAQAFSCARNDSRDYGSDTEETSDEVSNSDVTSEYEFSLTKPPPPDEVTVEDADAVLDDIRRATEMELKDIGISRSLGKSLSRDSMSESGMPNLCVRSYQMQNEGTGPKKPRLYDNVEDCWPFREDTTKVIHKKLIEADPKVDKQDKDCEEERSTEMVINSEEPNENMVSELAETEKKEIDTREVDAEQSVCENFYDACEALTTQTPKINSTPREETEARNMAVYEEKSEENKNDKANFLVTALVPQDMDFKPEKNVEEWLKNEKEGSVEKEVTPEKGKKFTCQLSIDFAAKVAPKQERGNVTEPAIEYSNVEEPQNQCKDLLPADSQAQQKDCPAELDKSLLTVKKANKCLEIKITQVDQKENTTKNLVHQKMVVKFGKDKLPNANNSQKFEFNLAVTKVRENAKLVKIKTNEPREFKDQLLELKYPDNEDRNTEVEASPRTVWNDATDDTDESPRSEKPEEAPKLEEKQAIMEEEKVTEKSMNLYEDSLRYEKNLEFFQQKPDEKTKDEEEMAKEKPTAILIQNGQTKLALIRY